MIAIAFYLWKSRKIWTKYEVTALYTVVLAGTAAALLTGVYCLGLALSFPYDWDLGAASGKQQAEKAKTQTVRLGPRPCARENRALGRRWRAREDTSMPGRPGRRRPLGPQSSS